MRDTAERKGSAGAARTARRMPELLAPAGGPDALLAAVAAGADAVYLGLEAFSARVSAENFSYAELGAAVRLAHAHGVRVYVALNIQVRDDELAAAVGAARAAVSAGADALIVADWGLAARLRRELPAAELHLSTQANVQSPAGVRAARALGFARVTTSRELTVAEIAALAATGVDVEVFCHGAICICYAGCCELSAHLRGRSANRGACVQPCRFDWELLQRAPAGRSARERGLAPGGADAGEKRARTPAAGMRAGEGGERRGGAWEPVGAVAGAKLLCPRDFCSIGQLADLAVAGVAALKIEGRMKNPDYVYNVTRTYRRALDALAAQGAGPDAADGGRPAPCGSRPLPYDADELIAQLGRSFNRGFTDAYLTGRPDGRLMSYERAINQGVRVGRMVERRGRTAVVRLERPVAAGDTLEIRFYPDESAKVHGPKRWPMVEAPRDAAAGEELRVSVKRRVDPPCEVFCVRSAQVLADTEAALAPLRAELSAYRVAAGESGSEGDKRPPAVPRAERVRGAAPRDAAAPRGLAGSAGAPGAAAEGAYALVASPEEARAALGAGMRVYACAWRMADDEAAWRPLVGALTAVLDETVRPGDEDATRALIARAGGVVCRNLAQVALARAAGAPFEVMAPLVARNAEAVRAFAEQGARVVWLASELGPDEAAGLAAALAADGQCGAVPAMGVLALDDVEAMVCAHCLLQAAGPCDRACAACARRREAHALRGADGTLLRVVTDARGRSRLFAPARHRAEDVAAAARAAELRVMRAFDGREGACGALRLSAADSATGAV